MPPAIGYGARVTCILRVLLFVRWQGWSLAEVTAPEVVPGEARERGRQWLLAALAGLDSLRRLALVKCHLRYDSIALVLNHTRELQV